MKLPITIVVAISSGCAHATHTPPPEPSCVEVLFSPGACATCIYTAPDYELAEDLEARCGKVCR